MKAARSGDLDAYGRIFVRFQDMAFAVALARVRQAAVAEEVAQEAFIEALMSLEHLAEPAAFPGWFRTIVERQSSRVLRSRRPSGVASLQDEPPAVDHGPERSAEVAEFRNAVMSVLDDLAAGERLVILMHYVADYSQAEIGEFLELPMTTVKKRLHTAKRKLRTMLAARARRELAGMAPSRGDRLRQTIDLASACIAGDTERARALIQANPDLVRSYGRVDDLGMRRISGHWGWTPLHLAAHYGHLPIVKLLVAKGADLDARALNAVGSTPLGAAVWGDRPEVTRFLAACGADLNARNRFGKTPLHRAAQRGAIPVVACLLAAGADAALQDGEGNTALDLARRQGDPMIMAALSRKTETR